MANSHSHNSLNTFFSLDLMIAFKFIGGREIYFTTGKHGKIRECEETVNTAGLIAHSLNVSKCLGFTLGQPLGM